MTWQQGSRDPAAREFGTAEYPAAEPERLPGSASGQLPGRHSAQPPPGRHSAQPPGSYGTQSTQPGAHTAQPGAHSAQPGAYSARPPQAPPPGADGGPEQPGNGQNSSTRTAAEDTNVVRSSGVMALGTLGSRGTGFLRTLVLAYVLGTGAGRLGGVNTAYINANTMPNAVYDLMLGGILTSVVVPLLVNAAKRDKDGGEAYDQRMFTMSVLALGVVTLVATAAASLLVDLYAHDITGPTRDLMVIFAYFFVPQIFFYGVSSLIGGVLNARGSFAAPMWTPIINNIVVIFVLVMFIAIGGGGASAATISTGQIQLLGFGTTLGIVAQTAALVPALRRVGFRWHPRFDFRKDEVAEIMRMAAPLFGYIVTTQISFLVVQNVANAAWRHVSYDGPGTYSYAWQLFQLPYAIVGISVITALLPRMSAHASERKFREVKRDFSWGVRLSSVIVVPASLLLLVLGAPLSEAILGYGHTSSANAKYIGLVFGIFSLGLVPYMMFQLMLRVFYAMHDSKTPMYIGVAVMVTNVVACLLSLAWLPAGHVVEGLGAAFGIANVVGTVVAWRILSRRMRGLAGKAIGVALVRMHIAAVPAAIFALADRKSVV